MADAPAAPTEEQVKEANKAEEAKWQGDYKEEDLTVPYKKEAEDGEDNKDGTNGTADNADGSDKGTGGEENDEELPEIHEEPAPVVTVADPGEYQAPDVSFKVAIKQGDKTKTVTIKTPEDAEAIADDPDNFETPKQLMDFINKQNKMNQTLDKARDKWQEQRDIFDSQTQEETQRRDTIESVAKEINYLVGKGKLPKVAAEYSDADWRDPEVAKQPGIKEQLALLNYMAKENTDREKAGIKPFGPVDALTAMQSDEAEKARIDAKKAAGEARKTASSKVAGVSPSQTGAYVPKGIAVGNPNAFKRGASVWDN